MRVFILFAVLASLVTGCTYKTCPTYSSKPDFGMEGKAACTSPHNPTQYNDPLAAGAGSRDKIEENWLTYDY